MSDNDARKYKLKYTNPDVKESTKKPGIVGVGHAYRTAVANKDSGTLHSLASMELAPAREQAEFVANKVEQSNKTNRATTRKKYGVYTDAKE